MTELSKIELDGAHPHMPSDPVELGALMRELRMAAKRDLKDVAQELRIRQPYLEAIEDGRLDDLPGPAYTTGFLRAYSDFLGLDGHAVVECVKEAGLEFDKRASLVLPSPVEDGGLPTGSLLLVAAMLAVVAYAGWYYVWTEDSTVMDPVSHMPAELASLTGDRNTSPPAAPATVDPVAAPREADSTPIEMDPAPDQPVTASTVAVAPMASAPAANANENAPTSATNRTPPPERQTAMAPQLAPQPQIVPAKTKIAETKNAAANTQAAKRVETTPPKPARTESAVAAIQPVAAPPAVASAVTVPTVPRAPIDKRRIRIRATTDSWVEIRDAKDDPLMSKLMQEGDSFDLESRPGLKLVTGNAGGLQLFVDTKKVPPLGPMGEILQDVPIDADSLLKR